MQIIYLLLVLVAYGSNFVGAEESTVIRQSGKTLGTGNEKPVVTLKEPKGGWTVDRMVKVEGSVSDPTVNPITISINGDRYLLRTEGGKFSRKFPVTPKKNSIVVIAQNKAGVGTAEKTVFSQVPNVPLMAILTSDTDGVYTDLHIYEPKPESKDPFVDSEKENTHVYWASTNSPTGGNFYLNEQGGDYDSPGYGPYLYTHTAPPAGIFKIDANYWHSGDKAHTQAFLNIILFGGTPQEQKKRVRVPLVSSGETRTLAYVRIEKGSKGYIYSPLTDKKPTDQALWPKWVLDAPPTKRGGGGGGD